MHQPRASHIVRPKGFTLIELMIVIAIIAIIAAIAIPNLLDARKSGNESSAIGTLRSLVNVQGLFRQRDIDGDGVADYAESFEELSDFELIDDVLASGTKSGYFFSMTSTSGGFSWHSNADPARPGTSGERYFFVDETGVVRFNREGEASERDEPVGGDTRALQARTPEEENGLGFLTEAALEAILLLEELAPGSLDLALGFVQDEGEVFRLFTAMDANQDGSLSFEEVLEVDVLGLAGIESPLVESIVESFFDGIIGDLFLDLPNEELPTVRLESLSGDLAAFLEEVSLHGHLEAIQDLMFDLQTDPSLGAMTGANEKVNLARQRILKNRAARMIEFAKSGEVQELIDHLEWLLRRTDGWRSPPDWVVGPSGEEIFTEATLALELLTR